MEALCRLFGKTKQAYYKYNEERMTIRMAQEAFAVDFIKEIREKDHGMGGMKLWYMYKRKFAGNSPMGRDRFEDVVDKYGLKIRFKVRKPRTTDSTHGLPTYPNLIREFIPTAANQLWVSDITYIVIFEGDNHYRFCYLTIIMDAYTEEIKGYCVGDSLETRYSIIALKMALKSLEGQDQEGIRLIHHSDRGVQYVSSKYVSFLEAGIISISMTENGDPKENPQAERINSTIKNEILLGSEFHSKKEVEEAVKGAVDFYNNERPHMSIGMMTPVEASQCNGERDMRWTSYRELAIKKKSLETKIAENSLLLSPSHGSPSGLRPPVNPLQG
ncbi:MAG: IS3 family transposase [Paludibacter sp.]